MPGFALVVNNKNEILLIQRGYGGTKGKWSLPGGRRDRGENLRRTAIRETREETGIKTTADSLYLKGRRNNLEVWRGSHLGGTLRPQKRECLDAKWFQMDMLPHDDNLAFGPDKIVIKKWADENAGSRRVHYPRSKMGRAGFLLVVSPDDEVLLRRRRSGRRVDKWGLPGGKPSSGQSRRDAAVCETQRVTGIKVAVKRFYYENRHRAGIWLAAPIGSIEGAGGGVGWFDLEELPDDDSLAFAIDVRTIQKWASEDQGSRRVFLRSGQVDGRHPTEERR